MVLQEGGPGLSSRPCGTHGSHVLLNDAAGTRECPARSRSPRIRSAPKSRLFIAISPIKEIVSWDSLGLRVAALDSYFQKSLKPWRCHRRSVVFLDNDEGLFPGSYHS